MKFTLVLAAALVALWTLLACSAADGAAYESGRGLFEEGGVGNGFTAYECIQTFGMALEDPAADAGVLPQECLDYFGRLQSGPCHEALIYVCGSQGRCEGSASCSAVQLMAEFSDGEQRCQNVLTDPSGYQHCDADDACDALVEQVCGGGPTEFKPCAGEPACSHAQLLEADARLRLEVVAICLQGLQEPSLYPRCSR